MQCWKKQSGAGKKQSENSPAFKLMQVEPKFEADFALVEEEQHAANKKRPARFVKVEGWGPQKKAVTGTGGAATAAAVAVAPEAAAAEAEPKKAKTEKD